MAITKYVGPYSPQYYNQVSTKGGYSTGPSSYSVAGSNTNYQKIVPSSTMSKDTLGLSTSNVPSYNNIPTNNTTNSNQGFQQINQGLSDGNAQIEADFNNAMSMLSGAEAGIRGQADTASQTIDSQGTAARNEIQNTQTTAETATNASLSTAEKQGASAMQQARDLYRQTQQQNTAQLSALGLSSSSVAEALAERLGVETAKRIAGVTGSLDEARQNATNELGRIKTYYQGKIADVQNQVAIQKANIQQALMQGLNQINQSRSQAASDKSAARASLLSQVNNAIYNLTAQQQQFEQSLQQWAQQKSAALTPIVQDPNYLAKLVSTANTFNQQFSPTGFTFVPQVNYDKNGNMTGQVTTQATKTTKKDPLEELYAQAGITTGN